MQEKIQRHPRINAEEIYLNTLFLQPTYACALDCEGCYVKGMEKNVEGPMLGHGQWGNLIVIFSKEWQNTALEVAKRTYANQLVLAVDVLPKTVSVSYPSPENVMVQTFSLFLHYAKMATAYMDITVKSLPVLKQYIERVSKSTQSPTQWNRLKDLSMITLSGMRASERELLEQIKTVCPDTKFNLNFTVFNKGEVDRQMAELKEILPVLDSVYYVLHKPALGSSLDHSKVQLYFDTLEVMRRELGDQFSKVNIDGCVSDARKFIDTGFGCSSNVSRFQVWPEGGVSGCAYQQHPVTGGALDYIGVLGNIRKAAAGYEFDDCRIPQTLHPTSERSRRRLGERKSFAGRGLQIID